MDIDGYLLSYNKPNAKPLVQFSPPLQPEEALIYLKNTLNYMPLPNTCPFCYSKLTIINKTAYCMKIDHKFVQWDINTVTAWYLEHLLTNIYVACDELYLDNGIDYINIKNFDPILSPQAAITYLKKYIKMKAFL